MMKRIRKQMLFFILCAFVLTACGDKKEVTEDTTVAEESENVSYEATEGFDFFGSDSWVVGGFYNGEQLLAIYENAALTDLYNEVQLKFNSDGSFVKLDAIIYEGRYKKYSGDSENECYLLKNEQAKVYSTETQDYEVSESKTCYLATELDENTIKVVKFDIVENKESEDDIPLVYVRKDKKSQFIEDQINRSSIDTETNAEILEDTAYMLGIGDAIETDNFKMTIDSIEVLPEYTYYLSDYYSVGISIEQGYKALALRGKIENKGMEVIKTDSFLESVIVNDSFTRDEDDFYFYIERECYFELDPYTEKNYIIYVNIPDKLADQYEKAVFSIGFRDDMKSITRVLNSDGTKTYKEDISWYEISTDKKKNSDFVTEEMVKEALQGGWTLDGSGGFIFTDDKAYLIATTGAASGTYSIDISKSSIHLVFETSEGNVESDLPYSYYDGTIKLINNRNEELKHDLEFAKEIVGSLTGSVSAISMSNISDISASSYLYEAEYDKGHYPSYLVDGYMDNAWVEGVSGTGAGESITLTFDGTYMVSGFKINAGYQKSTERYYENCRPASLIVYFSDGSSKYVSLEDIYDAQYINFDQPINTKSITFEIGSVYEGYAYNDTCISEISLY